MAKGWEGQIWILNLLLFTFPATNAHAFKQRLGKSKGKIDVLHLSCWRRKTAKSLSLVEKWNRSQRPKGKGNRFPVFCSRQKGIRVEEGEKNWYKQIYVPGTTLLQWSNLGLAIFSGMFRFSSHARKKKANANGRARVWFVWQEKREEFQPTLLLRHRWSLAKEGMPGKTKS